MCLGTATFCLCRKVAPRLSATWEPFAVCAPLSLSLSLSYLPFSPFPCLFIYVFQFEFFFFAFCQLLRFVYRSRAAFDPSSLSPYLFSSLCLSLLRSHTLPLLLPPCAATWPPLFGFSIFYLFFVCRFLLMFCELLLPALLSALLFALVFVLDFLRSIFVCVCLFHRFVLCVSCR